MDYYKLDVNYKCRSVLVSVGSDNIGLIKLNTGIWNHGAISKKTSEMASVLRQGAHWKCLARCGHPFLNPVHKQCSHS